MPWGLDGDKGGGGKSLSLSIGASRLSKGACRRAGAARTCPGSGWAVGGSARPGVSAGSDPSSALGAAPSPVAAGGPGPLHRAAGGREGESAYGKGWALASVPGPGGPWIRLDGGHPQAEAGAPRSPPGPAPAPTWHSACDSGPSASDLALHPPRPPLAFSPLFQVFLLAFCFCSVGKLL